MEFDKYVSQSKEIHGDKYEYISLYRDDANQRAMIIKCKEHGDFYKRTGNHIGKKQGCPKCSKPHKLTKEDFVEKANKVHKNKYDYTKSNYITYDTKIIITCKEHGDFEMTPSNHLKGQSCSKCNGKMPFHTTESFIEKANQLHNNKFDYSKVNYKTFYEPITIICKIHGEFTQIPANHLDIRTKYHCQKCSTRKVKDTISFIDEANKIFNNLYDYKLVDYKTSIQKVSIICKNHGTFFMRPNDHLQGYGCQVCSKSRYSQQAIKWLNQIAKEQNIYIQHFENEGEVFIRVNKKLIYFDGYCKDTNTIYEYYGNFWHGNPNIYKPDDINAINKKTFGELYKQTIEREEILKKLGYNLITIWESDFMKK